MIRMAKEQSKIILVDPKGTDYAKYAGATLLTPNKTELKEVMGAWHDEAGLHEKAHSLRERLGLEGLLVTRSEEGMTLFQAHQHIDQPTLAKEVFDVSGAGDTVIASLALGLALNLPLDQAMHLSNVAAGVVVAKLGTAVCSQSEWFDAANLYE